MTRSLLVVGAMSVCLSAALAAGGATNPAATRPVTMSATAKRTLQAGLSASMRQSLAGSFTRAQQLQVLQADPSFAARLQKLGITSVTQPMSADAWDTGVIVTPLQPLFPANATYENYQVSLETRAVHISPFTPLPTAGQTPPLMWLNVAANCDPLFWLNVKWPKTGAYMLTFMMKDLFPTSSAKPRVQKYGTGMLTPVPNKTPGGDCWTILWEVTNVSTPDSVGVFPTETSLGFMCSCLSKVIITRLH